MLFNLKNHQIRQYVSGTLQPTSSLSLSRRLAASYMPEFRDLERYLKGCKDYAATSFFLGGGGGP